MNRATFFKHFELLADQPDSVAKMREFVFQLAIQGLLVPQDRNDEPASELLKRIRAALESFVKEGKNGKGKPTNGGDEIPFKVPATWLWIRFGDIVRIRTGKLDANAAVENGAFPFFTCSQTPSRIATYSFDTSAVLLAGNGDFNLKYYVGKFDAYQRTYVIEPLEWDLRFCFILMSSQISRITENNRGSAIPYLKLGDIADPLVPLPPLAEQRRIVAKVDELMALCGELEQRQQARQRASGILQQSALHHLLAAREPQAFAAAWQRVRDHFHLLHDTPEAIPQLRQAILQLAVQGRLVPQNPKDEPASDLLAGIRQRKERLVEVGKVQNEKQAKARNAKQALFSIPETWQWARLSELTELITKGSSPKWQGISYVGMDEGVLFITSENVGTYELRKLDDLKYVEKRFNEIEPRSMLRFADILMNLVGASIGRTAVYNLHVEANINQAVALIRLMPGITDEFSAFLLHYLNSQSAIQHMLSSQVVNAQPNISLTDARDFPVPVPPLAEQKRIVARVEELLRWCDTLEAQLHQTRTLGAHLLDSTLHHLLAA